MYCDVHEPQRDELRRRSPRDRECEIKPGKVRRNREPLRPLEHERREDDRGGQHERGNARHNDEDRDRERRELEDPRGPDDAPRDGVHDGEHRERKRPERWALAAQSVDDVPNVKRDRYRRRNDRGANGARRDRQVREAPHVDHAERDVDADGGRREGAGDIAR